MARRQPKFKLPGKLERILATLATHYRQHDKPLLEKILVNSKYYVEQGASFYEWNGGIHGHVVYLYVPFELHSKILDDLESVGNEIRDGINRFSNLRNEPVTEVFLELADDPESKSWRERSGALIHPTPTVITEEQLRKIWKPGYLRLFISHKADYKKQASQIKEEMDKYGVSCFVAHKDIEPTKEWQGEIERALFSMDALVALMTENFADSHWTDQEIGVAIGRQVPVVPVRLGRNPYGFIGKYQAVAGSGKDATRLAKAIYDALWAIEAPLLKERLTETLIRRFETPEDYNHADTLMKIIEARVTKASPDMIERLEQAFEQNRYVSNSVKSKFPKLISRLRGQAEEDEEATEPFAGIDDEELPF